MNQFSLFSQEDKLALDLLNSMSDNYKKMKGFTSSFTYSMKNLTEDITDSFSGKISVKDDKYVLFIEGQKIINDSNTVLWNGPAGYFENPNFQTGTKEILEIITQKTINDKIFSVAGGGETVAAINKFKKFDSFTFVSTAGGAFLEYLEGKTLPGIKALSQNV